MKKLNKQILSALLALLMFLNSCPVSAFAADLDETVPETTQTIEATQPEVTDPPVTEPPVTAPPTTEPPTTEPPTTEPPTTEPPTTEPPASEPPASDPAATDPAGCQTCGKADCTVEHTNWCAICEADECGKDHSKWCDICKKDECGLTHVFCEICKKHDCGVAHVYCETCEAYDCGVEHVYCKVCKVNDCGKTHVFCKTCDQYDCGRKHVFCDICNMYDCIVDGHGEPDAAQSAASTEPTAPSEPAATVPAATEPTATEPVVTEPVDNCPYCDDTTAEDGAVVHASNCNTNFPYNGAEDVGKYATLTSDAKAYGLAVSGNPKADPDGMQFYAEDFEGDVVLHITGWYWDVSTSALWYRVGFYSGSVIDEAKADWPAPAWILNSFTNPDNSYGVSLSLFEGCSVCDLPDCETEHVKCAVCGTYDCTQLHPVAAPVGGAANALLGSSAPTITSPNSAYAGNVNKKAAFNSIYFYGGSYPISDAPWNEISWSQAAQLSGSDALKDVVLVIRDVYDDGSVYWYKVEAAEGSALPTAMENKPWIFQNNVGASEDYDSLVIQSEPSCPICGTPGCTTEHVRCDKCGNYDCKAVHFWCEHCQKYNCGVTHTFCPACGAVDCKAAHTFCPHCGKYDCGLEHEDLFAPITAPVIPENPQLSGDAVSIVDGDGNDVTGGLRLAEGTKTSISAWPAGSASSYQWQICVNNADQRWIDIYGATSKGLLVSPAMFRRMIDYYGKTYVRCVTTSGENTLTSAAIPVIVEEAVPPQEKMMMFASRPASYAAAPAADEGGESGTEIQYSITILWQYAGMEQSWVSHLAAGEDYVLDVPCPEIPGYIPKNGQTSITQTIINIQSDITIKVEYVPDFVDFKVEHYHQKVTGNDYDLHETVTVSGKKTGDIVGTGLQKTYTGFDDMIYDSEITVAADGSTVVKIYYDRDYYMLTLDLNGGYGSEPIYARYGTPVTIPDPQRTGYSFAGWKNNETNELGLPGHVPAFHSGYTAQWTKANTEYTVAFWYENANPEENGEYLYTFVGSMKQEAVTGTTVNGSDFALVNSPDYTGERFDGYKPDYAKHFSDLNANKTDSGVTVKEDGTTVVNVYFYRNSYKLEYKVFVCPHVANNEHTGVCCSLPEHTHTSACCNLQHIHSTACCSKEEHIHNQTAGACCNIHVHTIDQCISSSWLEGISEANDQDYIDACNSQYPNAANGQLCTVTTGSIIKTKHYFVCFDGKWYRRDTGNTNQIIWDNDSCGHRNLLHKHGSGCNTSKCGQTAHTHGDGNCNASKCGITAHDHSSGRLGSCNLALCSNGGNAHTHGSGCNTDICPHSTEPYFLCPCLDNDAIRTNPNNWVLAKDDKGNDASYTFKYEANVGSYHAGVGSYRWCPGACPGFPHISANQDYGHSGAVGMVTSMPGGYTVFYKGNSHNKNKYTVRYWLETYDGTGKEQNGKYFKYTDEFKPSMGALDYNIDYIQGIPTGFGVFEQWACDRDWNQKLKMVENSSVGSEYLNFNFYYARNSYDLTYFNGSKVVETRSMMYDQPLTVDYDLKNLQMTSPYGSGYAFAGWYLDSDCAVPVQWNNTRMPDGGMAVYAKWEPVQHTVTTRLTKGGAVTGTYQIYHGETVSEPVGDPKRTGYEFIAWFYEEDGEEIAYDFSMPVYKDMTLYAKWTSDTMVTGYIYYKDEQGNELATATEIKGVVGDTKTYNPKVGTELNLVSGEVAYFPDFTSHSITFGEQNATQNEYTFTYKAKESVAYRVHFIDKDTKQPLDGVATITGTSRSASITVDLLQEDIKVSKYTVDAMRKTFMLSADESLNDFYFYFTKDEENATVQVEHYIQNKDGTAYNTAPYFTEPIAKAKIGDVVSAAPISITGFTHDPYAAGTVNNVTLPDTGIVLRLYYTRNSYPYEFRFAYKDGANNDVEFPNSRVNGTALYGKTVQQSAKSFDGYELVSSGSMSITVDAENPATSANIRTFYYQEAEVTIRYQLAKGSGGGTVDPKEEAVKAITGQAAGSTATANPDYVFSGWYSTYVAAETDRLTGADQNKYIPQKTNGAYEAKTYYAKFEEVKVALHYQVVMPQNATATATLSRTSEMVSIFTGKPEGSAVNTTPDGYRFDGWYDSNDNRLTTAASYAPPRTDDPWVDGTTYYAKFVEKTATIHYAAEGPGSVNVVGSTLTSETVNMVTGQPVGAVAVPTENTARFVGWYDSEGNELPVGRELTPPKPANNWPESTTYTAKFELQPFEIIFDPNGGTAANEAVLKRTYTYGDTLSLPEVTNGNYKVTWTVDKEKSSGNWVEDGANVKTLLAGSGYGNVTLIANWTINLVWVDWDVTHTNLENAEPLYVLEDAPFGTDADDYSGEAPERTDTPQYDYEFTGWEEPFKDQLALGQVTGIAVYRAVYSETPVPYTITYVLDGGTVDGAADGAQTHTVEYTVKTDLTLPEATKDGHIFNGWKVTEVVTGDVWELDHTYPADGLNVGTNMYGNVTLTAQWISAEFTITWLDEDGSLIDTTTVAYDTMPTHADPVKAATAQYTYTFTGWTPELSKVTGDATYQATYSQTVNQYEVTFVDWNGTVLKAAAKYDYGTAAEDIVKPADPTRAATAEYTYAFAGWSPALAQVTGNATYRATYTQTANSYKVTWVYGNGNADKVETVTYGAQLSQPADPQWDGYDFVEWSPAVPATMPAKDQTFTAQWEPHVYTVRFNGGGATSGSMEPQEFIYGTEQELSANAFSLAYNVLFDTNGGDELAQNTAVATAVFTGWARGQTTYEDKESVNNLTPVDNGKVELTAQWELGKITLPLPTKTGYNFVGWYERPDTRTRAIDGVLVGMNGDMYKPQANVTLYAEWEAIPYTITWLDENGSLIDTTTVAYDTMPTHADPTKAADEQYRYEFTGWDPQVQVVTGDATYKATYKALFDFNATIDHGTITYGTQKQASQLTMSDVEKGSDPGSTLIFTPELGYEITGVKINGEDQTVTLEDDGTYIHTFAQGMVAEERTIDVTTAQIKVIISIRFDGGENDLEIQVQEFSDVLVAITPQTGTTITSIKLDYGEDDIHQVEGSVSNGYIYSAAGISKSVRIVVEATSKNVTCVAASIDKGTVSLTYEDTTVTSKQTAADFVPYGADYTFTLTADSGRHIAKVDNEVLGQKPAEHSIAGKMDTIKILAGLTGLNDYTVTYILNNGSENETVIKHYADVMNLRAAPERPGYTFQGWWYDSNGNEQVDDELLSAGSTFTMPAQDVTLTAQWVDDRMLAPHHQIYVGINMSFYENNGSWYYTYPNEPATVHGLKSVRLYIDDNVAWKVQTFSASNSVTGITDYFTKNLPGDPRDYIKDSFWDSDRLKKNTDDGTIGIVDTVSAGGLREDLKFSENDYTGMIAAWLEACRDANFRTNQNNVFGSINVNWDAISTESSDYDITPYVIKLQGNGHWYVDMVIQPKVRHRVEYRLDLDSAYTATQAPVDENQYGTGFEVKMKSMSDVAWLDDPAIKAKFLGWCYDANNNDVIDEDEGNTVYRGNELFTMPAFTTSSKVTMIAQWDYPVSLTIRNTADGERQGDTFLFRVQGTKPDNSTVKNVDMIVSIRGTGSVTIKGLYDDSYTVTPLTEWSWTYTAENTAQTVELTTADHTVTFVNTFSKPWWLFAEGHN